MDVSLDIILRDALDSVLFLKKIDKCWQDHCRQMVRSWTCVAVLRVSQKTELFNRQMYCSQPWNNLFFWNTIKKNFFFSLISKQDYLMLIWFGVFFPADSDCLFLFLDHDQKYISVSGPNLCLTELHATIDLVSDQYIVSLILSLFPDYGFKFLKLMDVFVFVPQGHGPGTVQILHHQWPEGSE